MFEVESQPGPTIELHDAADEFRPEQRHAATDVAADQVRVDQFPNYERRAYGRSLARMQIREADRESNTVEFHDGIELAHGFAFDPASGRGEKAHLRFSPSV